MRGMRIDRIRNEHIRAQVRCYGDKVRRLDWDGLDTCRGGTVNILVVGCWMWSYQAGGKEDPSRDSGMWWESWCDRRRCRGQVKLEEDDLLWQLLEKRGKAKGGGFNIPAGVIGNTAACSQHLGLTKMTMKVILCQMTFFGFCMSFNTVCSFPMMF